MVIIGSGAGSYEEKLKQAAEKIKGNRIIFKRFMRQKELPVWYSAADVGFWGKASITIIEGMACRLPIVVPDLDTVRHLAEHQNGCMFKSFRNESVVKCFKKLMENRVEMGEMGKRSEKAVEKEYNYRARTKKLMKIYERIT
jgi:glycosyltransferase involved in cell wall biosynthesis